MKVLSVVFTMAVAAAEKTSCPAETSDETWGLSLVMRASSLSKTKMHVEAEMVQKSEIRSRQKTERGEEAQRKEQVEHDHTQNQRQKETKEEEQSTLGLGQRKNDVEGKQESSSTAAAVASSEAKSTMLDLTIVSAADLKKPSQWGRSLDPYVRVHVNNKPGIWLKTGSKSGTHPAWHYKMHFSDYHQNDLVVFELWDHNWGADTFKGRVKKGFECNDKSQRSTKLTLSEGGGSLTVDYKCHLAQSTFAQIPDRFRMTAEMSFYAYRNTAGKRLDELKFLDEWNHVHDYSVTTGTGDLKSTDSVWLYKRGEECALIFEGSADGGDSLTNLNAIPWRPNKCGGFWVHKGFYDELSRVISANEWKEMQKSLSGPTCAAGIYAVGHSMGGALASIFTACVNARQGWFEGDPFHVKEVYTFGAPAASKFWALTEPHGQCLQGTRFFIEDEKDEKVDIVPLLPPIWGWHHPKLKAVRLTNNSHGKVEATEFPCSSEAQYRKSYPINVVLNIIKNNIEQGKQPIFDVHLPPEYIKRVTLAFGS